MVEDAAHGSYRVAMSGMELVPHQGFVALQDGQAIQVEMAAGRCEPETARDRLAARLQVISDLHLQGETYRAIGATLGLSKSQVAREVAKIRSQWAERTATAYQQRIDEEDAKLDYLERSWLGAAATDGRAAQLLLQIMDRRARLLGLDKPQKSEVKVEITDVEAQRARAHELLDELARRRAG